MTSVLSVPGTQLSADRLPAAGGRAWPKPLPGAAPLPGDLEGWLAGHGTEMIGLRRHLHAHPELSHREFDTARLVADELSAAGLQPRLLPAGNGVICDVGRGDKVRGDKVVALRADLDALPLEDIKDVEYRSTVAGATHACGHDVHTTTLLWAGRALARLAERDALPGRVRLIFQPAEETMPSGAPDVISAGGLKDVAGIFSLHCAPRLATGQVGVRVGPFTAATDKVEVTVTGPGGHTARPHLSVDLVHALARLVVDVPALLERRVDPRAGISMVFGAVQAGEAPNAIPTTGTARATVRALNREAWRSAPELITGLVQSVAAGTGAEAEIDYTRGVPPVINDHAATAVITDASRVALGTEQVTEAEISMGGEDFAFYLEHVPGAMIRLGTGIEGSDPMDIHQSSFDVDERCIGYGVRVLLHTALAALESETL